MKEKIGAEAVRFNARLSIEWIAASSVPGWSFVTEGFNARLSIEWIAASVSVWAASRLALAIQCPLEHRVDCCRINFSSDGVSVVIDSMPA